MKKHSVRLLALLLAVVMVLSVMPTMALAEGEAKTFAKVTSADGLTTGQYVLVVDTGYAMGEYDNGKNPWITAVEPSIANGKIENPTAGIWTLTVSNDGVIMTDAKEPRLRRRAEIITVLARMTAISGMPALLMASLPLPELARIP